MWSVHCHSWHIFPELHTCIASKLKGRELSCLQQRQTVKSTLSPVQVCLIKPNYDPELAPLKGYDSSHGKWWEKDKHQTNRYALGLRLSDGTFGIRAWGQSHRVCAEVAQTRRRGCRRRTTCQGIWVWFIPLWHLPVVSVPSAKSTLNNWNGGNATRLTGYWSDKGKALECTVHLSRCSSGLCIKSCNFEKVSAL